MTVLNERSLPGGTDRGMSNPDGDGLGSSTGGTSGAAGAAGEVQFAGMADALRMAAWTSAAENAAVKVVLDASGLPAVSRERLAMGVYKTPAELSAAVDAERDYLAKIAEANTVKLGGVAPRGGGIQVGLDGKDQITLALEAGVCLRRQHKTKLSGKRGGSVCVCVQCQHVPG